MPAAFVLPIVISVLPIVIGVIATNLYCPEQTEGRESSRIQVMDLCARTGQIDVHSYECERGLMNAPVGSTEVALHEPHIGIDERVPRFLSGLGVGLRHHPADVCE